MKFIGTSIKQDFSFCTKNEDVISEFNISIDIKSINIKDAYIWVNKKIESILKFEDEILENLIISYLEKNEVNLNDLYKIILPFFKEENSKNFIKDLKIYLENIDKKNIEKIDLNKLDMYKEYQILKDRKKILKNKLYFWRKIIKKSKKRDISSSSSII